MKVILLALIAAVSAAAVHAVTIDWSTVADSVSVNTAANGSGSQSIGGIAAGGKWVAACVLTVNSIRSVESGAGRLRPAIFGVCTGASQTSANRFGLNRDPGGTPPGASGTSDLPFELRGPGAGDVATDKTLNARTSYELVISYNGTDLNFYIDGVLCGTLTNYTNGTANNLLVWGQQGASGSGFDNAQLSSGMDYTMDIDYVIGKTYDDVRAVPEPTVLALLALGVAGVAFRRRIA